MSKLTSAAIESSMLSSVEGFSFLVVNSLEFELGRELIEEESMRVYRCVEKAINEATREAEEKRIAELGAVIAGVQERADKGENNARP